MNILVGIKHVPDTETKFKVSADGRGLDPSAVGKWIISPYDEYALEQALQFREARGGEVTLVCCAGAEAQPTLRQGLAMGADRALLVQHAGMDGLEALIRARAIAAVVQRAAYELVLLGKYGVGTDEGQTGPMLAELLGWPHVSAVSALELQEDSFTARREVEGGVEVHAGRLPAVISCEKGLNEPRYPSLKGIMQAKRKPLETLTPQELGLDMDAAQQQGRLVWESVSLPPPRSAGRIVEGSAEEAARELVRLLHEEAKVI